MCGIAFEHAESVKILVAAGNLTSAACLIRLQYEAFVRAMWLKYSASDRSVSKLMGVLSDETAEQVGKRLPMLTEMLRKLDGRAPDEMLRMLLGFKEYSLKPLNSFVHGGIHAIHRHSKGYPVELLFKLLRNSNGISILVGMLLVTLHGDGAPVGRITALQKEFRDCLPESRPPEKPTEADQSGSPAKTPK